MLKAGKYRAFRNIPIGWMLQAIHSTDSSERYFRIVIEILMLYIIYNFISSNFESIQTTYLALIAFVVTHTLTWFITGNFWVYMLDSFLWVRNPGISGVIKFIEFTRNSFVKTNSVNAILIYGSMCRQQLHIRSDLDLRVLRKPGVFNGFVALSIGYLIRLYSFFIRMPVDLEVVDSMDFIRKQMREDEKPINVFLSGDIEVPEMGMLFEKVVQQPDIVLRDRVSA